MSFERAQADDLRACVETGTPAYVLVDPLVGEPMPGFEYADDADLDTVIAAREAVWKRPVSVIPIDRHSMLGDAHAYYPYLVGLDGGRDDLWLADTLDMALAEQSAATRDGLLGDGNAIFRIGGWLMSGMRTAELVDALAALFRPDTEALLNRAYYLRLPDPRQLYWLRRVVGEARLSAALGRIRHWYSIDMCGRLAALHSPGETAMPLRFTQPEWRTLLRGEEVHAPVAMALGAAADGWWLPDDPYEGISRALDLTDIAAKRWPQHFAEPRDRAAWAALCLLHGDLATYDLVRERMDAPPEQPRPKPLHRLAGTLDRALRERRSTVSPTH